MRVRNFILNGATVRQCTLDHQGTLAKALADGRDMTEIGLMRDIALRTIAVLGGRRAEEPRGLLRPDVARNRSLSADWKIGARSRRAHHSATAKQ
jgi:hypothetical protein